MENRLAYSYSGIPIRKVFISYYERDDKGYKNRLIQALTSKAVDRSVGLGDIATTDINVDEIRRRIRDEHIADSTVTIVLIGRCTWQRKHVDWEIQASLIQRRRNPRNGLVGILLPTHPDYEKEPKYWNTRLIPPRLADNLGGDNPFAAIYKWPKRRVSKKLLPKIESAFQRRNDEPPPNNSLQLFAENRSGDCLKGWQNSNRSG